MLWFFILLVNMGELKEARLTKNHQKFKMKTFFGKTIKKKK